MKKLNFDFMLAATILLGSSMAMATTQFDPEPNVYNANNSAVGAPDWQPITSPADAECEVASSRLCAGFRETPSSEVQTISTGNKN